MNASHSIWLVGPIVEEEVEFTLFELRRATGASEEQLALWTAEGALEPQGAGPQAWRFDGRSLCRVRIAQRLTKDLDINAASIVLALDLLDEIDTLRARLRRVQEL